MSESEIIPVTHQPERESVTSLLTTKTLYPMSRLAQMSENELLQLQRRYYQEALTNNVVTMINLVTRHSGVHDVSGGRIVWRHPIDATRSLEAIFLVSQGSAEVRIDKHLVFSNQQPGSELIVPGQWLYIIAAEFRRIEDEKAWRDQMQVESARENLMLNLGADV